MPIDVEVAKGWAETAQAIITTGALIAGGVWAYLRFLRDRTYRPRLELAISGRLVAVEGTTVVLVTTRVKNVGLSRVKVSARGTGIMFELFRLPDSSAGVEPVQWQESRVIDALVGYGWVEAGEVIIEDHSVAISTGPSWPARATLRVVSDSRKRKSWRAVTIITTGEDVGSLVDETPDIERGLPDGRSPERRG